MQPKLSFKVELYYMILERLEKYKEALDVVRGKLGGNFLSINNYSCVEEQQFSFASDLSTGYKKKRL